MLLGASIVVRQAGQDVSFLDVAGREGHSLQGRREGDTPYFEGPFH